MLPGTAWEYDSTTPFEFRRRFSPILAAFPWQWDGLVSDPKPIIDFADEMPQFHNFIQCLHRHEAYLFSFRDPTMLNLLGVNMICPSKPSEKRLVSVHHADECTVFEYLDICSVVSAYRLFEILALHFGHISPCSFSASHPHLHLPRVKMNNMSTAQEELHGFKRLKDWIGLAYSFKATVEKYVEEDPNVQLPLSSSPIEALLCMLRENEKKGAYIAIENNFIRAAIHMGAQNMIVFPEHIAPDLPGDLQKLGYHTTDEMDTPNEFGVDLTVSTLYKYQFTGSASDKAKNGVAGLHASLQLAILLTPFFLWMPFQLAKKSFNRRLVLQRFAELGSHKPPIISKLEGLVLSTVILLSRGRTKPYQALKGLVQSIDWSEVDQASTLLHERTWFSIDERPSQLTFDTSSIPVPCQDGERAATGLRDTPSPLPPVVNPASPLSSDLQGIPEELSDRVPSPLDTTDPKNPMLSSILTASDSDGGQTSNSLPIDGSSPVVQSVPTEYERIQGLAMCDRSISEDIGMQSHTFPDIAPSSSPVLDVELPADTSAPSPPHPNIQSEPGTLFPEPLALNSPSTSLLSDPFAHDCPDSPLSEIDEQGDFSASLAAAIGASLNMTDALQSPMPSIKTNLNGSDTMDPACLLSDAPPGLTPTGFNDILGLAQHDGDIDMDDATSLSDGLTSCDAVHSPADPSAESPQAANMDVDTLSTVSEDTESHHTLSDYVDSSDNDSTYKDGHSEPKGKAKIPKSTSNLEDKPNKTPAPAPHHTSDTSTSKHPSGLSKNDYKHGDNADDPIDVDSYASLYEPTSSHDHVVKEEISFTSDSPSPRIKCDVTMQAYDAEGNMEEFVPEFHFDIYNVRFKQFIKRVERGYVNGLPPHLSAPAQSCIKILSYSIFVHMGTSELNTLMVQKHLVVTGCPLVKDIKFDKDGMRELAPLMAQVSINDFSIEPEPMELCTPTVVSGYVKDILFNATISGKILNGLDFPMWNGSRELNAYSVDLAAWDFVRGLHSTDVGTPYPTEHTKWWTAGTDNTLTFLHIDCDGFGTEDGPQNGKKLWGVLQERSLPLSSITFFLDGGFCLNEVLSKSKYNLEAIVLRPGDRIYMKPLSPHFVFGLMKAICYGSHYYATCLMQETLQGVIHAFVLNRFLTNTSHQPSRQLLRRILFFYQIGSMEGEIPSTDRTAQWHLPNIHEIDGFMNFLSVAILVFLGNVLDFCTYSAPNQHDKSPTTDEQAYVMFAHDINAIPYNERLAICYACGVALHVIRWMRTCCEVKGPDGKILDDFPSLFIVQLLSALLAYKAAAERRGLEGAPHCTYNLVCRQVNNVVECDAELAAIWYSRPSAPATSLALESKSFHSITWKDGWETDWRSLNIDYRAIGKTPFDRKFFDKKSTQSQKEAAEVLSQAVDPPTSKKRKLS